MCTDLRRGDGGRCAVLLKGLGKEIGRAGEDGREEGEGT